MSYSKIAPQLTGLAGLVWHAVLALAPLVACATGSGSPADFLPPSTADVYGDGAAVEAQAATAAGPGAPARSYGQAAPPSCDATCCDASPSAPDDGSAGVAVLGADDASAPDAEDAPFPDADDGAAGDADDAAPVAASPWVGDLVITEIMFDPSGPVPEAQWFEVYNLTSTPEILDGLTIQDGWGDAQTIPPGAMVIVPPFAYAVLVRDLATAVSNAILGASIVYEYGAGQPSDQGIELASDATGDLSLWSGGLVLVDVPYGPWGLASPGQSIELGALQYAGADQPASWCLALYPWAPGSDDGTPGLPNDCP